MYVLGIAFTRIVARAGERHVETAPIAEFKHLRFDVPRDLQEARALDWVKVAGARKHVESSLLTYAAGPISQMVLGGKEAPTGLEEFYLYGGPTDAGIIGGYALALAAWGNSDEDAVFEIREELIQSAIAEAADIVETNLDAIAILASRVEAEEELPGHVAAEILRHAGVGVRGS